MLIALMMKGQTQHASEPRRHQQWYLMRLSQLNYPQGNKDGGQHLLLPTDIYRTCWVLQALEQWKAVCCLIRCYGRWIELHLLLKSPSQAQQTHKYSLHKWLQQSYCICTTQRANMQPTLPLLPACWIWPSPAAVLRWPRSFGDQKRSKLCSFHAHISSPLTAGGKPPSAHTHKPLHQLAGRASGVLEREGKCKPKMLLRKLSITAHKFSWGWSVFLWPSGTHLQVNHVASPQPSAVLNPAASMSSSRRHVVFALQKMSYISTMFQFPSAIVQMLLAAGLFISLSVSALTTIEMCVCRLASPYVAACQSLQLLEATVQSHLFLFVGFVCVFLSINEEMRIDIRM